MTEELSRGRSFLRFPQAFDPRLQFLLCSPREEGPAISELTGKRDLPAQRPSQRHGFTPLQYRQTKQMLEKEVALHGGQRSCSVFWLC